MIISIVIRLKFVLPFCDIFKLTEIFRNYPPDLIISIVKSNICLQIFPVNLASITGNLPFFGIFNLSKTYCEIILLIDNFILLQNLLKMENVFQISPADRKLRSSSIITNSSDIRQFSNFLTQDYPSSILVQRRLHKT